MPKYCVIEKPVPIKSPDAIAGSWVVHLASDIHEERKERDAEVARLSALNAELARGVIEALDGTELNMGNYNQDDVEKLNNAAIEAWRICNAALSPNPSP